MSDEEKACTVRISTFQDTRTHRPKLRGLFADSDLDWHLCGSLRRRISATEEFENVLVSAEPSPNELAEGAIALKLRFADPLVARRLVWDRGVPDGVVVDVARLTAVEARLHVQQKAVVLACGVLPGHPGRGVDRRVADAAE